ncbi:MAG: NAD(P)-dependent oxidoreductase [Planctomycetes bacterium]|nr:NAD(P)-dependent oxidoreductase [Planctomycetota bacterium]
MPREFINPGGSGSVNLALTGGTGMLGGAILAAALHAGHRVRALCRTRPDASPDLPTAGLDWVEGRLEDPASAAELLRGTDAVLHCAYCPTDDPETFVQANIAGTLRLLAGTPATGARQFVFVSSLAVFGPEPWSLPGADRLPLDEDFPLWPRDFYGAHKLALEKMVIAAAGVTDCNTSAFRVGCVLGRHRDPARDHLARFRHEAMHSGAIREHFGAYVIAAEDAAAILVGALGDPTVRGRVFHTFDRWLDFADLQGPLTLAVGRPVSVHCERAPEPSPGLRRDRLDARAPVFRTDAAIIELLAD